jgi:hypothetical protein
MPYTIKRKELNALSKTLKTDVAEVKHDLRRLMDMLVALSVDNQSPITTDTLILMLPWLAPTERQLYLAALERAGYVGTCYGGHDSRCMGW